MNRLHLRFVLNASLLSLCLLFPPSSFATAEDAKPQESQSQATRAAETRQLRGEVESLRRRVEQLEQEKTANVPHSHGGDAHEKDRLLAETRKILAYFHGEKASVWK